jgi:hypothetical protein
MPSATPERVIITPPPASAPEPLPMMDARVVVAALTDAQSSKNGWWWSPGRLLGPFGLREQPAGDAVALKVTPPANAQIVLEPRRDGVVRVSSMGIADGTADPLGCAPGSFGRYRIAATDERLDLVLVSDPCEARAAAIAGTWQGTVRLGRRSMLFGFPRNPQVEAFRIRLGAAGLGRAGGGYVGLGRDQAADGSGPFREPGLWRGVQFHRSDISILIGFPTRADLGACVLDADPANDTLLLTADAALEDLRARPGIEVTAVRDLVVDGPALLRVDVAVVDEPGACFQRALFASDPGRNLELLPLWHIPEPEPGTASAPIYLATVPGRGSATTAVAILVEPTVDGVDRDAVATQVFEAIDWQPELDPPDWPVP